MAHRSTLILVLAMASLCVACDKAGVYPLGLSKDVIVQCEDQSTWIRSIEGATEVFVIGSDDIANLEDQLADGATVCFNFATVAHDSTTRLFSGVLTGEGGQYQVHVNHEYYFPYEPDKNIVLRLGARRDDFEPPLEVDVDFALDGGNLVVDYDGTARRLTRLGEVISLLDGDETELEAPGGPKDIYRMFNLSLFVGQPRIPGFGGTGMTKFDEKSTFTALISGEFTIEKKGIADIYIEYLGTEEIEGVVIDGLQITYANLQGQGTMEGILDVAFFSDPESATPHLSATVDYKDLIISGGVAGGGTYTLTHNGNETILEYDIATDEDLTGILPISDGVP